MATAPRRVRRAAQGGRRTLGLKYSWIYDSRRRALVALLPLRVPQGGTRHYLCLGPAYLCDDVPGRGTDVWQPLLMVLRGGCFLIFIAIQ